MHYSNGNSTININNLNFLKFDNSMGGVRNHAISDKRLLNIEGYHNFLIRRHIEDIKKIG